MVYEIPPEFWSTRHRRRRLVNASVGFQQGAITAEDLSRIRERDFLPDGLGFAVWTMPAPESC